jgi:hypothetical protein
MLDLCGNESGAARLDHLQSQLSFVQEHLENEKVRIGMRQTRRRAGGGDDDVGWKEVVLTSKCMCICRRRPCC